MEAVSDERIQLKRRFADFFEREYPNNEDPSWSYAKGLTDLYQASDDDAKAAKLVSRRLVVSEHHLRDFDPALLQRLLRHPAEVLPAFEDALGEFVRSGADPTLRKLLDATGSEEVHIGLKGDFGKHELSPRDLTSDCLGQLVCLFGIVTKCSLVRPKVVKTVHYCEDTKAFTTMEYRDVTALSGLPTGASYPQRDESGRPLTTEYGMCKYRDSQMITVQELPETAPPGQLPHSAEIVLEGDLVDRVKPGDRVSIVGVYKAMSGRVAGQTNGVFKAVLVGVSVHKLTKENTVKYTLEEVRQMRSLAERHDILSLLGNSLAPSIFGHDIIKRGLVLQLFGGLEKNLANGTHLRGDINCLLVGDPGVAKSQLLRATMNIAPHAVSTTGRGSSGVGLTAAVTTDQETGEKRLEAGAMVLADRGVVCIDEFDKMSEQDRVAIHEVMEQQTVTIAKAGIHTSLNARCSVLAAANPLYGSYDKTISVTRNVNLPDSLLSRFDMLFVVLDAMNESRDRQVAMHVLKQHRYRPAGEDGKGAPVQETIHDRALSEDEDGAHSGGPAIFQKHDNRLHSGPATAEVLTPDFLRKYIIHARRRYGHESVKIAIDDEAAEEIVAYYTELRRLSKDRALPVTARTLETIIRLATASCKVRLRYTIDVDDVEVAKNILDHVMKKNVGEDESAAPQEDEQAEVQQQKQAEEEDEEQGGRRKRGQKRGRRGDDEEGGADDEDADGDNARATRRRGSQRDGGEAMDMDGAQAEAQADRRAARAAKRQATQAVMSAMGMQTASERQEQQQAAAAGGSGAAAAGGVLAGESRAAVNRIILELFDEFGREDLPVDEVELRVREAGISRDALLAYLDYAHNNYEKDRTAARILYDAGAQIILNVA